MILNNYERLPSGQVVFELVIDDSELLAVDLNGGTDLFYFLAQMDHDLISVKLGGLSYLAEKIEEACSPSQHISQ